MRTVDDQSKARFWDKYKEKTKDYKVPVPQQRCYVKHVGSFIKALQGKRLIDCSRDDMRAYLSGIGRNPA